MCYHSVRYSEQSCIKFFNQILFGVTLTESLFPLQYQYFYWCKYYLFFQHFMGFQGQPRRVLPTQNPIPTWTCYPMLEFYDHFALKLILTKPFPDQHWTLQVRAHFQFRYGLLHKAHNFRFDCFRFDSETYGYSLATAHIFNPPSGPNQSVYNPLNDLGHSFQLFFLSLHRVRRGWQNRLQIIFIPNQTLTNTRGNPLPTLHEISTKRWFRDFQLIFLQKSSKWVKMSFWLIFPLFQSPNQWVKGKFNPLLGVFNPAHLKNHDFYENTQKQLKITQNDRFLAS